MAAPKRAWNWIGLFHTITDFMRNTTANKKPPIGRLFVFENYEINYFT